jgi:hypothetical protein
MDLIYLAIAVALFSLTLGLAALCARLMSRKQ